jgi:hypothetical protein
MCFHLAVYIFVYVQTQNYGRGIYAAPKVEKAFQYANGGEGAPVVFVCLALPGRQHVSVHPADKGKPCRDGFDSHIANTGLELVFFFSTRRVCCR